MISDIWRCYRLIVAVYRLFRHETLINVQNVKQTASACGPIGLKFLQFIAMHDGIVSADCKKHFRNVFDDCSIHDWKYTEECYKATFGRSIYDDFEIKSKIPIGSGSIGQVYKFFSKEHNCTVAIKVKHPRIDNVVNSFVTNISYVLKGLSYICNIPFSFIIQEFLHNIKIQLDYTEEAKNTETMRKHFASESNIVIPQILHSTKDIIIMTYHDGVAFPDLPNNSIRDRVACDVFLFMATSLVCHNFVHCDMHYGNWKVDPQTEKLIIYDCGIIGSTGNHNINIQLLKCSFEGDYMQFSNMITPTFRDHPRGQQMEEYIAHLMDTHYQNTSDRFADFMKKAFEYNIPIDNNALRCVQGLIICISTIFTSTDKLLKIIGPDDQSRRGHSEVFIFYIIGLLQRTHKYAALQKEMESWTKDDPTMEVRLFDWMEDRLGHRDMSVFLDVLQRFHYPLRSLEY